LNILTIVKITSRLHYVEKRYIDEKRKQPSIAFPSATNQEHVFIIRFDISDSISDNIRKDKEIVRTGLRRLCGLFGKIARDELKINELLEDGNIIPRELSRFKFSATVGFGLGFFRKLNIAQKNIPKKLKAMPDYSELADIAPYSLFQTDFIIQLAASVDYVNRWVFQNQTGITKKEGKKMLRIVLSQDDLAR